MRAVGRQELSQRPCLLVHYHEISLKGGNRPLFLRFLARNLTRATADLPPVGVVQLPGRIVLDLAAHPNAEAVRDRARAVFGVANLALADRVPSTLDHIKSAVARLIEPLAFESFRVTARRAFKTYPLTSPELNRELGTFVLERAKTRVDLERPALNIRVEVLPGETFVYAHLEPGPGGLPVGVSGQVMALLSGGIDSPVAAWRMMKRGCQVLFIHFHSVPYLPATSQAKAKALVNHLTRWQYASRLWLVPFGEIQREVVLSVPPPARVVIYRRLMLRIAEAIGRSAGAEALVTGESLGQVASQTLGNLARIEEAASLPILRPLIGMDKLEITEQARRLGTYEISVEPDQDCCTLFVPKHPATRTSREDIQRLEVRLPMDRLVAAGVDGAEVVTAEFPEPSEPGSESSVGPNI
jgi:thiamine biosynthesis protein ThiI